MCSQFLYLSKSRPEIYPLIGAVSFAVGMGVFASTRSLLYNPDVKVDQKKRSNPLQFEVPKQNKLFKE